MEAEALLDLRAEIAAKRASFPFLAPYLKGQSVVSAMNRNKNNWPSEEAGLALIQQIEDYQSMSLDFLDEQTEAPEEGDAINEILFGYDSYINDVNIDKDEYLDKHIAYYECASAKGVFTPPQEMSYLCLIICSYMKSPYPWRAKKYANLALNIVEEIKAGAEFIQLIASYFYSVCDLIKAYDVALNGAKRLLSEYKASASASLFGHAYGYVKDLPGMGIPSEKEIGRLYPYNVVDVMKAYKMHSIHHDPIEATEAFQSIYDEVMEEATEKYLSSKAKIPQLLWSYMEEGFAKRGVLWSGPQSKNPGVMFD